MAILASCNASIICELCSNIQIILRNILEHPNDHPCILKRLYHTCELYSKSPKHLKSSESAELAAYGTFGLWGAILSGGETVVSKRTFRFFLHFTHNTYNT